MTLQSTASVGDPLTMSEVRTELGASGTITLTQTSVRTLFAVPSGTIRLLQGLGKSNAPTTQGYRPSTATGNCTNPANAYDTGTSTTVDSSTYAAPWTNGTWTTWSITSGSVAKTGTLHVKAYFDLFVDDGAGHLMEVQYSPNNGTTWYTLVNWSYSSSGGQEWYTFNSDLTVALTSVVPTDIKVRVVATQDTWAQSWCDPRIYDIVFIA